jgi:hypothetical protein
MNAHIYVCMYICIYIQVQIYTYINIYAQIHICLSVHACRCVYIVVVQKYILVYKHAYKYLYIHMELLRAVWAVFGWQCTYSSRGKSRTNQVTLTCIYRHVYVSKQVHRRIYIYVFVHVYEPLFICIFTPYIQIHIPLEFFPNRTKPFSLPGNIVMNLEDLDTDQLIVKPIDVTNDFAEEDNSRTA